MTPRYTVGPDDAGRRLDVALAGWLDEPRSQAAARIERGEVEVGTHPAAKSHRVRSGEVVTVRPPSPAPVGDAGVPAPPTRYEDDDLLVVAKPAGMTVHPGGGRTAGTLVQALAAAGVPLAPAGGEGRPGVVHRLDRTTSGLLIVAKTDRAHAGLVAQLKARTVQREYLALVEGVPPSPRLRIEVPIARDPHRRTRFAARSEGRPAVTHVTVMGTGRVDGETVGLVGCRLETGRTHQIRVHLSHAGHPVAGDRTYGGSRALAARLGLQRPFLHAARLRFHHPVTGAAVDLTEPLPPDLGAAAAAAGVADHVPADLRHAGG